MEAGSRRTRVPNFQPPIGTNFRIGSDEGIPTRELAAVLTLVVDFLSGLSGTGSLLQYDDWWQHDGLHFYRATISFDTLRSMVNSPQSLQECTSDDFMVHTAISASDFTWYLRWYLDDANRTIGGFDVTVPTSAGEHFRKWVVEVVSRSFTEEDATAYYARIKQ